MAGMLAGSLVFGRLGDKLGRRPVLTLALALLVLAGGTYNSSKVYICKYALFEKCKPFKNVTFQFETLEFFLLNTSNFFGRSTS